MKRLASIITALCLSLTIVTCVMVSVSADERFTANKIVAFGDSVVAGLCIKGPNNDPDAYGDQKAVDLLGQEFGLSRYTSAEKIKAASADKWFINNARSGAITGQIKDNQVKSFDAELLAQADLVYMNGGTNDACSTMSDFLGKCGWGSSCSDWTLEETKQYVEKNSTQMSKIATMIKDNFVEILTYITGLEGFKGKIVIQNYPNQYAKSENTNAEYLWDEFYEKAVNAGQRAAIDEVSENYSNIYQLDVTKNVRDGMKYTNIGYGDAQHLTFDGNREIYRQLSLMLNPDGENLLTFESTEIPENAVWRTAYDFEKYEAGTTSVAGAALGYNTNNVVVADMSETYDSEGNPKQGTNTSSQKILKCNETGEHGQYQVQIDLSSFMQNAYGVRFRCTYPTGNSKNKYFEFKTSDGQSYIRRLPINSTEWQQIEMKTGSSFYKNWYSTIMNTSMIQKITSIKIWGDQGTCFYLDDIEVLTTDESLPEVPDVSTATSKKTEPASSTTTTATPLPDGYYDAYTAVLGGGAKTATNHTGYLGSGFVDNFGTVGSSITFNVNVAESGNYTLNFRYSNACGNGYDSYPALYIDGVMIQELNFKENGKSGLANFAGWNIWSENTEVSTDLTAGAHSIKLIYDRKTYSSNVDGLTLVNNSAPIATDPTSTTGATTTTTSAATTTTTTSTAQTTAGPTTTTSAADTTATTDATVVTTTTTSAATTTTTTSTAPTTAGPTTTTSAVDTTTTSLIATTTSQPTTAAFDVKVDNDTKLGEVVQKDNGDGTFTVNVTPKDNNHKVEFKLSGDYEIISSTATSITFRAKSAVTVSVEYSVNFLYGDVNGDNKVTAADVLLMRKHIAGQKITLNTAAADVNLDNKITAADVLLVRKYIAGQKVVLGK